MDEIVLLFDRACPYTTGQYIERAAVKRGMRWIHELFSQDAPNEVNRGNIRRIQEPPTRLSMLASLPIIMIDDSSPWTGGMSWLEECPRRCFWAIDTHVAFPRILEIARHFPLVYAAQHDGTEALRAEGINAHWLPVAAEPDGWHKDLGVERDIDVAFVGNVREPKRMELMRLVEAAFDSFALDQSQDPAQISAIYSRAKVVINQGIRNDVNMRIFEAASCGAEVVTNCIGYEQWEGLDILHSEYGLIQSAIELIADLIDNEALRRERAVHNQRSIRARHTYAHRLDTMLAGLAAL